MYTFFTPAWGHSSAAVTMPDSVDRSEFKSTLPCFLKEPLKAVVPFYLVSMPVDVKDPTRGGGGGGYMCNVL